MIATVADRATPDEGHAADPCHVLLGDAMIVLTNVAREAERQIDEARRERDALKTMIHDEMEENVALFALLGVQAEIEAGTTGTKAVTHAIALLMKERDEARAEVRRVLDICERNIHERDDFQKKYHDCMEILGAWENLDKATAMAQRDEARAALRLALDPNGHWHPADMRRALGEPS
jgi:hypothetical protein